jgi:uncharacterized protein DUF6401
MTNEFLAFAPISAGTEAATDPARALPPAGTTAAAPTLLDEMMARVGVDGLVAAHTDPGLLAQVDQHAAAVREALAHAGRATDAEGLASYAKSIAAAAERMGRPVPQPGHAYVSGSAWLAAEWHLLRLVAVCMIAESSGLL